MHIGRAIPLLNVVVFLTETFPVLFWLRPWNLRFSPYQRSAFITLIAAIYVQVVCLSLLLVIRFVVIVAQAFHKPLGLVTNPFDFYALTKDGDKPGFFTRPSEVAFRCVAFCTLYYSQSSRLAAAMISTGLSSFSDASLPLSLRWPSSHTRSPTLCSNPFKRRV